MSRRLQQIRVLLSTLKRVAWDVDGLYSRSLRFAWPLCHGLARHTSVTGTNPNQTVIFHVILSLFSRLVLATSGTIIRWSARFRTAAKP